MAYPPRKADEPMKTAVLPLLLLPFLCPAQSDTVAVPRDRLVRWAANRALADDMLREKAVDYARCRAVIEALREDMQEADAVIREAHGQTAAALDARNMAQDKVDGLERKVRRSRRWAWIGWGAAIWEAGVIYLTLQR